MKAMLDTAMIQFDAHLISHVSLGGSTRAGHVERLFISR